MTDKASKASRLRGIPLMWNYPGVWWRRSHWLKKIFMIMVFVGLVSGSSVAVFYMLTNSLNREIASMQRENIEEISRLRSEIREERERISEDRETNILDALTELKAQLETYDSNERQVLGSSSNELGTSIDEAIAALEALEGEGQEIFGYIKINDIKWDDLEVYKSTSVYSTQVASLSYGRIYPVTDYLDGWYKIDVLNGLSGWVMEDKVSEVE